MMTRYAINNTVSTSYIENSIEITEEKYIEAIEGMISGKIVSIDNGFAIVDPPPKENNPVIVEGVI